MPREDIDHPALTIDREGHLRLHLPTGQESEHPGRRVMHCRVPRVDKATEIAAPPAYDQVKTSVQSSSDRAHFPQRNRGESALFDPPNDEPRHVRDRRDILLGLPVRNANRSKRDADLLVVHRPDNGRGRLSADHQPSLAAKPSRCRFLPLAITPAPPVRVATSTSASPPLHRSSSSAVLCP